MKIEILYLRKNKTAAEEHANEIFRVAYAQIGPYDIIRTNNLLPLKSTKKNNALSSVDSCSDYKYIFKSF